MTAGPASTSRAAGKPVVLVLMGGYWPGHEATGPNQSLRQMCVALAGDYTFAIVARDRPFGAAQASAPAGRWVDHGFAAVRYTPVSRAGPRDLRAILRETPHDLLWLNGFHDREFTLPALAMRRLGLVPRQPAVLSVRGELAGGALGLKSPRKRAYRTVARNLGLASDVWLHATGVDEAGDVERWFPWSRGVVLASNVCELLEVPPSVRARRDVRNRLRLVFVGRFTRVKNLTFALEVLRTVKAEVDFDIYGPIEDRDHWRACEALIAMLPPNIRVRHAGTIAHDEIPSAIGSADLLFSPSLSENFGHAIIEALSCEVPALISDRTPWKNLQARRAGWSLSLDDPAAFAAAIEAYARMPLAERALLRAGARALAEKSVAASDAVAATRRMLSRVIEAGGRTGACPVLPHRSHAGAGSS